MFYDKFIEFIVEELGFFFQKKKLKLGWFTLNISLPMKRSSRKS